MMNRARYFPVIVSGVLFLFSALPLLSQAASLKSFVQGSYTQIERAYAEQPFFVSLWSIDCPPCVEELPEMAEYFSRHPDIALVLISTDGIALADEVEQVLGQNGLANADSWIFAESFVERLRYEVDSSWQGELPRSYYYTPGQTRQRIRGRIQFNALDE